MCELVALTRCCKLVSFLHLIQRTLLHGHRRRLKHTTLLHTGKCTLCMSTTVFGSAVHISASENYDNQQPAYVYTAYTTVQGAQKSNPLGKIRYLWNCSNFFAKFTTFTEEDSGHISCEFHCNIWLHSKIITI